MEFQKLVQEMEEHIQSKKLDMDVSFNDCCKILDMQVTNSNMVYYRAVRNNPINEEDFSTSYREKYRRYNKPKAPKIFCLLHGVSIFDKKDELLKKITSILQHYPPGSQGRLKYVCEFNFYEDAGLISNTGESHKTFYKSDTFRVERLNVVSIREID